MTSPSDEELYDLISKQANRVYEGEKALEALKELLSRRNKDHRPTSWVKRGSRITQVTCSCGKTTKYRVHLNSIEDFECPKKGK